MEENPLPGIEIRAARAGDSVALAEMMRAQFELQAGFDEAWSVAQDVSWERFAGQQLVRRDGAVFIARAGETVVGYVSCAILAAGSRRRGGLLRRVLSMLLRRTVAERPMEAVRSGVIEDLYVAEEFRRRSGVSTGTRLHAAAVEWLRGRGARHIDAYVYEANEPGRGFFSRAGYEPVRTQLRLRRPPERDAGG